MAKKPSKHTGRALGELREQVVELPPAPPVQAPIPLGSVLGQDRATEQLGRAMRSGKVHHAWIFEGPFGVGKFTTSLAFAAMLLDETTQPGLSGELSPDPQSRTQAMLAHGSHPDLSIINKELAAYHTDRDVRESKQRAISVKVVREFILERGGTTAQVATGASMAGRVFIIDEAELLNDQAQNALLKFLEEPPARTVLLLACNAPEQLLPTIRSRCQRVAFGPLAPKAMQAWLRIAQRASENSPGLQLDPSEQSFLMGFASGSPGALMLCYHTGIGGWWKRIEPLLVQVDQGTHAVELGPTMSELIDAWAKAWVEKSPQASKEAANHAGAGWMLRLLAWHYQTQLASGRGSPKTAELRTRRSLAAIDAIRLAEREAYANVNLLFVMDKLGSSLASPDLALAL